MDSKKPESTAVPGPESPNASRSPMDPDGAPHDGVHTSSSTVDATDRAVEQKFAGLDYR